MISWILRRVKLVFGLIALAPFALLAFSLYDANYLYPQKKEVFEKGVETAAEVEGGTRTKRRRSGTTFTVNLAWQDKAGKPRKAEKVYISNEFADRIIKNDLLTVDSLKIKYLEADDTIAPLVLDDTPKTGPAEPQGFVLALATLPIALLGGAGFYFLRRREKRLAAAA
jgi:LPXTG-motif cell wall-anchored protein